MLTRKKTLEDFNRFKKCAYNSFFEKKYENSLKFIRAGASLAYHLNFTLYDDDFENLLANISKEILGENYSHSTINGRYVFYDFFGLDSRGLTQQYISALGSTSSDVLFIISNFNKDRCKNIINQIKEYKNIELFIVEPQRSIVDNIKKIHDKIKDFKPEKAFLQLGPSDVVGVCVWDSLPNTKRYLINITDHSFWIGKNCFDHIIEYREYGIYISSLYRKIPYEKILLLKYYPLVNNTEFKGFPINTDGKKVIFSGGAYYKIYGEDDKFFKILKRILDENNDVIILFAGTGDDRPFRKFIIKNNFEDKIFLLGNRSDIDQVFIHSDIFISTYPISGGLMCMYAVAHNKLPIAFTDDTLPLNYIEPLFDNSNIKITHTNLENFHNEVNEMLLNEKERKKRALKLSESIQTRNKFDEEFRTIIQNNYKPFYSEIKYNYDSNKLFDLYLNVENNYLNKYDLIKLSSLKTTYFRYCFFDAVTSLIKVIFKNNFFFIKRLLN